MTPYENLSRSLGCPYRWLTSGAAGITLAALGGGCTTIPVVQDGRAVLPVLVAPGAAPAERSAAEELGRVLGKMAGLDWPVRFAVTAEEKGFHIGPPPWEPLKVAPDILAPQPGEIGPDGFRIRSHHGNVFIEGATPEATGFAVAWLLQHEGGVRWYAPGPTGEMVPRRTTWSLPELNIVRAPAYISREIFGQGTAEGTDWARHNGLRRRIEFTHALTNVFPPEVLAAHPEWVPLVQGRRQPPASAHDYQWQPNLALPDVAEHAGQVAAEAFGREPGRVSFSLGMNDTMRFDQSAATRGLVEPLHYFRGMPDYSPLVFTFMNRAAESLARANPDRYLGGLAYFWCENVPPFPVNPQVMPYVTTDRAQYYDPEYRTADLALMSRWGLSGVRAFGLWEYAYGEGFLVPRVPHRALAAAIHEGWQRGARGYFADTGPQGGFDAFKVWLLAQLLWDPARSYEELADDFHRGYYGAAARPMRRFFERCEEQWMTQTGPPYWLKYYRQEDQALLFPASVCEELRPLIQEAIQAAVGNPELAARVEQTSRAFAVTEAYGDFFACRQSLATIAAAETADWPAQEAVWVEAIAQFVLARTRLEKAFALASEGESPAMTQTRLVHFVRNDPVPRLLWLAGQRDPALPRRLLAKAGAENASPWCWVADSRVWQRLAVAPVLTANSSLGARAPGRLEPAFLHPLCGVLPADWEVRAMPTETGRVALVGGGENDERILRIEDCWDTQVFQWQRAEADQVYLATARLRGNSGPGNDAALFLTFLDADGKVVGVDRMQSVPKGSTPHWWTAVLADRVPATAAWVGIGVGTSRQVAGDWLELTAVELRGTVAEEAP